MTSKDTPTKLLEDDRSRRVATATAPPFVTLDGAAPAGGLAPFPGTVTVYVGDPEAAAWQDLKSALQAGDLEALSSQTGPEVEHIDGRTAVERLTDSPVYGDLRYAGRSVIDNVGLLSPQGYATAVVPYNGGPITAEDFQFVEYTLPESRSNLEYFVVARPPRVSELEGAILAQVPAASREIQVGVASKDETKTAREICDIVRKAAQDELARRRGAHVVEIETQEQELINQVVESSVDPSATAVELLSIRRQALGL
jgi:hypothetical protein